MRALAAGATCFALLGSQALALSCLQPNPAQSFNWFQESEDRYRLAVGQVNRLETPAPYFEGEPRSVGASFGGRFFERNDRGAEVIFDLHIASTCLASWCGGFPEVKVPGIFFLKMNGDEATLEMPPCQGSFFALPAEVVIDTLQNCLQQGKCTEQQIQSLSQQ
ncbi:MAG: hypothetical protein GY952_16400 [Rhodobacteraceae bacterium]|nr:hypothetical protein [Paracoccaceae bacterium]